MPSQPAHRHCSGSGRLYKRPALGTRLLRWLTRITRASHPVLLIIIDRTRMTFMATARDTVLTNQQTGKLNFDLATDLASCGNTVDRFTVLTLSHHFDFICSSAKITLPFSAKSLQRNRRKLFPILETPFLLVFSRIPPPCLRYVLYAQKAIFVYIIRQYHRLLKSLQNRRICVIHGFGLYNIDRKHRNT